MFLKNSAPTGGMIQKTDKNLDLVSAVGANELGVTHHSAPPGLLLPRGGDYLLARRHPSFLAFSQQVAPVARREMAQRHEKLVDEVHRLYRPAYGG